MRAVRLLQPGRPLQAQEIPVPAPGPAQVLVRVMAAGICHSDAHYRAGRSPVHPLPLTLGHEVAGIVVQAGPKVSNVTLGDRVCLHYLVTCGQCNYCRQEHEQFCRNGQMIGKHRDGGYAEFIVIPASSALRLPDEVPFEQGAILMCSAATALHALRKARLSPGETVAVFGIGGLGSSAIQLARLLGARQVFAIDIKPAKLALAQRLHATPINAAQVDPLEQLSELTGGRGVDVALELIGLPLTMRQAVRALTIHGRAALAGITDKEFSLAPYPELINKEAELVGVSDHLLNELPQLLDWARDGKLDLSGLVTRSLPLEAGAINGALDRLEQSTDEIRTVILPHAQG